MTINDHLALLLEHDEVDDIKCVIVKNKKGYFVKSEDRSKNLGGPYKTRSEAESRLREVEYFKHKKG